MNYECKAGRNLKVKIKKAKPKRVNTSLILVFDFLILN